MVQSLKSIAVGLVFFLTLALSTTLFAQGPETGLDYTYAAVELTNGTMVQDAIAKNISFSLNLKNKSSEKQVYLLGVEFRSLATTTNKHLPYILPVKETVALEGEEQKEVEFSIPSPEFLIGKYDIFVGATDEEGKVVGMARISEIELASKRQVFISKCVLNNLSTSEATGMENSLLADKLNCEGQVTGEENAVVNITANLVDSRYAKPIEIGKAKEVSLSNTNSSFEIILDKPLPAGFYQIEVSALDPESSKVLGLPFKNNVSVVGQGGKINAIAQTKIESRDGVNFLKVAASLELYDSSTYKFQATLSSEGVTCALPISVDINSVNEVRGEFTLSEECQYPAIEAKLISADGTIIDTANRVLVSKKKVNLGEVGGSVVLEETKTRDKDFPFISIIVVLVASILIISLVMYSRSNANKKDTSTMLSIFFLIFSVSIMFGASVEKAEAGSTAFTVTELCIPPAPCNPDSDIYVNVTTDKDVYAGNDYIRIDLNIVSGSNPQPELCPFVRMRVGSGSWTPDLVSLCYTDLELISGVNLSGLIHTNLRAPSAIGLFDIEIEVYMLDSFGGPGVTSYPPNRFINLETAVFPDLRALHLGVNGNLTQGSVVTFSGQVYNNGTGPNLTDFSNRFRYRWGGPGNPVQDITFIQPRCATDAFMCPDGTGVSRSGPRCEFSCPDLLAPGATSSVETSPNLTLINTGTLTIFYCDDYLDEIVEITEGLACPRITLNVLPAGPSDPAPTINSFTAPTSVASGSSPDLSWDITNATDCTIDQGVGVIAPVTIGSVAAPAISAATTYTLSCMNSASGPTTATVTVAVPSGFIDSTACVIPAGGSGCNSTILWETYDFISAPEISQGATVFSSDVSNAGVSRLVTPTDNVFTLSDSGSTFTDIETVDVSCDPDSVWITSLGICSLLDISIDADPNVIRSNSAAILEVEIDSPEDLTCTISDGGTPTTFSHIASPTPVTYSPTTRTLTSAQIVSIECESVLYPGVVGSGEVRINVVPTIQEI